MALFRFLLEPQAMVLPGPIDVDFPTAHGLEGTLHADGPDVDMGQHDGDEQHADNAVDHLCRLHAGDVGHIEWEHEQVAGDGCCTATQHHHPVDGFLTGIETPCRWMIVTDEASAFAD